MTLTSDGPHGILRTTFIADLRSQYPLVDLNLPITNSSTIRVPQLALIKSMINDENGIKSRKHVFDVMMNK